MAWGWYDDSEEGAHLAGFADCVGAQATADANAKGADAGGGAPADDSAALQPSPVDPASVVLQGTAFQSFMESLRES